MSKIDDLIKEVTERNEKYARKKLNELLELMTELSKETWFNIDIDMGDKPDSTVEMRLMGSSKDPAIAKVINYGTMLPSLNAMIDAIDGDDRNEKEKLYKQLAVFANRSGLVKAPDFETVLKERTWFKEDHAKKLSDFFLVMSEETNAALRTEFENLSSRLQFALMTLESYPDSEAVQARFRQISNAVLKKIGNALITVRSEEFYADEETRRVVGESSESDIAHLSSLLLLCSTTRDMTPKYQGEGTNFLDGSPFFDLEYAYWTNYPILTPALTTIEVTGTLADRERLHRVMKACDAVTEIQQRALTTTGYGWAFSAYDTILPGNIYSKKEFEELFELKDKVLVALSECGIIKEKEGFAQDTQKGKEKTMKTEVHGFFSYTHGGSSTLLVRHINHYIRCNPTKKAILVQLDGNVLENNIHPAEKKQGIPEQVVIINREPTVHSHPKAFEMGGDVLACIVELLKHEEYHALFVDQHHDFLDDAIPEIAERFEMFGFSRSVSPVPPFEAAKYEVPDAVKTFKNKHPESNIVWAVGLGKH